MFDKVLHLIYFLFQAKGSGLERTPKDDRDFNTGIFGWGDYKSKHNLWIIKTLSVKDQKQFNTCQWNATIVQKEVDEGIELSVMRFVSWAKRNGHVSGNGFSNLKSGQIALKEYGAEPKTVNEDNITNWETYSNAVLNTAEAAKHKISSFWSVTSKNDILKLLDDGRILTTGIDWFSGFNQGGGFGFPWLISRIIGYLIGGHAIPIVGYDFGYKGRNVFIMQNSYSSLWGDTRTFILDNGKTITMSGLFYIDMDYLIRDNYGIWTNLDIKSDIGKFLNTYDGKNVKGSGPAIYYIQRGKKKVYPDELSYLAYNTEDGNIRQFEKVDDKILNDIPEGDIMDLKKSLYWDFLKDIKDNNARISKLIQILGLKK